MIARKYYPVGKIDVFRGPDIEHQEIFDAWVKKHPDVEKIYKKNPNRIKISYESPSMVVSCAFSDQEYLLYRLKYPSPDYHWFMGPYEKL